MSSQSSSQESSSQQTEQQNQQATSNFQFECEDVNFAFNNGVALLESKFPLYKDMLLFLSNSCISKALTIQPFASYTKYLRELWYTVEVTGDSITFSLLKVDKPLSFNRDILSSVIGLDSTKDFVSLPPHEAVKEALATLGLSDDKRPTMTSVAMAHSSPLRLRYFSLTWKTIAYALCWGLNIDIAGILFNDLVSKLTTTGKKRKEKGVCYVRYLSLVMEHLLREDYLNDDLKPMKPYQITNATFKDSKISEQMLMPLVTCPCPGPLSIMSPNQKQKPIRSKGRRKNPSSSELNVSKYDVQTPHTQAFESQLAEETEVTADATQSLDASKSAEEHDNQPQTADTTK
ncbi:hypothetical protein Tco_1551296, partial [Tanacetum coccineum]